MNFEKINPINEEIAKTPVPENNTLPLKQIESENFAEGNESTIRKTKVLNKKSEEKTIALKQSLRHDFADDKEMAKSREFYEFLKNCPAFGKFVPDTLYFKARETEDDKPRSYNIQPFIDGERIDRVKDEDLYRDPEVVKELLELCDAGTKILKESRKNKAHKPDFMWTPESGNLRARLGAVLSDPRYSSNIVIANEPDKYGRRVFFVDTGVNASERSGKLNELQGRHIVSPLSQAHFKRWRKKLEKIIEEKFPEVYQADNDD